MARPQPLHPRQWEHGGYHEIVKPKQRYRTISRQKVTRLLDVGENELPKTYQGWIKEALRKGNLSRDEIWSSKLAVGDAGFVEQIKKNVGRWVSKMAVNEDLAQYGQQSDIRLFQADLRASSKGQFESQNQQAY